MLTRCSQGFPSIAFRLAGAVGNGSELLGAIGGGTAGGVDGALEIEQDLQPLMSAYILTATRLAPHREESNLSLPTMA